MLNGRGSHAATRTVSGDVLIVGGEPAAASQETYSAASGTFGSAATIGTGPTLNWPTTTLLEFGFVLIAGGNEGANANWSGTFAPTPASHPFRPPPSSLASPPRGSFVCTICSSHESD